MSDDPDSCVTDYIWMNIQTDGLGDNLNGILGLNADPDAFEASSSKAVATSYIDELYDAGIIDERVFAFALRDENDSEVSYMDVGFYDEAAMDDSDDLVWIDVVYDRWYGQFWWHNYMEGVRFRDQVTGSTTYADSVAGADDYATTSDEILAIADSGSSCLVLSDGVYEFVIEKLLDMLSYYEVDSTYGWGYLYYCSDVANLKTIDILWGGVWLEVSVDDYIVNFDGYTCAFCVTSSGDPFLTILGDSFMRNYYVIHDMETMQTGIAPLANVANVKAAGVYGEIPIGSYTDAGSSIDWLTKEALLLIRIALVVLFMVILPLILIWWLYCRPKPVNKSDF